MKKVIVSGAAGFIGNAVARQLISQGVQVVAVVKPGTNRTSEAFRLKNFKATVVECDLKEVELLPKLIKEKEYDAFYQFAWDGLDKESFLDYEKQIDGIKWIMKSVEAASALRCNRFIGAGSVTQMELFNQEGRMFTDDRHKYFRSVQLACETMGRALAREKGIQFIWPIIINVYGEGETSTRLINSMIRNLLAGKHQSFSSGKQLYDFIHIQDAAKAFCLIGDRGKEESQYMIGSGSPRQLKEYLNIIRDIVAPEMQLGMNELEFHGLEMTEKMLNIDSLVRDTGFNPEIEFEEVIRRTLEWIVREDKRNDIE